MDITIVIPVHNRAHLVGRTLESVRLQTARPAAVVLVDNNSTDSSLDVCRRWARERNREGWDVTVVGEPEPGACAARNRGLALVRSRFVMFFDSDDEMLPTHVEDFQRAISAHPGVLILGRTIRRRLPDGSEARGWFRGGRNALFHNVFRATMATARYMAATELVRRVGGWDTTVKGWNDWELGMRLLMAVEPDQVVDIGGAPTVLTHFEPESITGSDLGSRPQVWEHALEVCRADISRAGRQELAKWADARAAILAAQYAREGRPGEARRLLARTLERTPHPLRIRLIYMHNRWLRRLSWAVARMLFPWG